MDEDRQVAWMRETLPHTPLLSGNGDLNWVEWGRVTVYTSKINTKGLILRRAGFLAILCGYSTHNNYNIDFGWVMSNLVDAIKLRQVR